MEEQKMSSVGSIPKAMAFALGLIVLIFSAGLSDAKSPTERFGTKPSPAEDMVFEHGGLERSYKFYKPQNLPAYAPLVFVLHGRNQYNSWSYSLGFNQLADANGFAVAYPQGVTTDISVPKESSLVSKKGFQKEFTKKKMRTQKAEAVCEDGDTFKKAMVTYVCRSGQWDEGKVANYRKASNAKSKAGKNVAKSKKTRYRYTCWNASGQNSDPCRADDVGFLSTLARHLQVVYKLNPDQTFVTGFSKGGYMSYTLACQASDVFRAAAPVAALIDTGVYDTCSPKKPMPILHIHGTADQMVPITGNVDKNDNSKTVGPSVVDIIGLWSGFNQCTAGDSASITDTTTAYYCRNGTDGNEVHYYKIRNHNHIWPGMPSGIKGYFDKSGLNAAEIIWNFFSKY